MNAAERYRHSARRCLAVADVVADQAKRSAYLQMAQLWRHLAEIAEREAREVSAGKREPQPSTET
jgi:hypothetical protein